MWTYPKSNQTTRGSIYFFAALFFLKRERYFTAYTNHPPPTQEFRSFWGGYCCFSERFLKKKLFSVCVCFFIFFIFRVGSLSPPSVVQIVRGQNVESLRFHWCRSCRRSSFVGTISILSHFRLAPFLFSLSLSRLCSALFSLYLYTYVQCSQRNAHSFWASWLGLATDALFVVVVVVGLLASAPSEFGGPFFLLSVVF